MFKSKKFAIICAIIALIMAAAVIISVLMGV